VKHQQSEGFWGVGGRGATPVAKAMFGALVHTDGIAGFKGLRLTAGCQQRNGLKSV